MKMYFDFRDVFKALRIAFSFQRIWTNSVGIAFAYVVYLIFAYISFLLDGTPFSAILSGYGLFPTIFGESLSLIPTILYWIGVILAGLLVLVTNTAVSRLAYMQLRNEFFYTWRQAFRFAFKKFLSIVGAYFTFIFMIAFFVIGALVMGLIGRIPAIGEWLNALLTIPYIFAGLLLAFIALVSVISIILIPAVLATMDEDALGGVFHSFSVVYNQPWRLGVYSALAGILEIVGFAMYAVFIKVGYTVFAALFTIGMGEKFFRISETSLAWLQKILGPVNELMRSAWGSGVQYIYFSHPHTSLALSGTEQIAAVIMTIFLFLVGLSVLGYAEATGNTGMTLTYLAIYKRQEDENLLEREDEELKEEEEEEDEKTDESSENGGEEDSTEETETDVDAGETSSEEDSASEEKSE